MSHALRAARPQAIAQQPAARPLIAIVFEGLSEESKHLSPTLAFDPVGAALYEALRRQPEHYAVRAEDGLLLRHAAQLAELAGPDTVLVDFGSGDGRQAGALLGALRDPHMYVPIDLEPAQLSQAARRAQDLDRRIVVRTLCQDLRHHVSLPPVVCRARRRLGLLGGMPFDGYRPLEAVVVLSSVREALGPQGALVIGVDLVKDRAVMERAYEDAAGRAAAFNINLLERINRDLDATFDGTAFRHRCSWNEQQHRIELSLVSACAQSPRVAGIGVTLARDEQIRTLESYKYTRESFAALSRIAGWDVREFWIDPASLCGLCFLESAD